MKPGQTAYLLPARIEVVFQGFAANGRTKVFQGGRQISVHLSKVAERKNKWIVGEPVTIQINGIDRVFRGEVIGVKPVKARVTEFHGLWNGAVLGTRDAKIMREEMA